MDGWLFVVAVVVLVVFVLWGFFVFVCCWGAWRGLPLSVGRSIYNAAFNTSTIIDLRVSENADHALLSEPAVTKSVAGGWSRANTRTADCSPRPDLVRLPCQGDHFDVPSG